MPTSDPNLERRALQVLDAVYEVEPGERDTRLTDLCGADDALRVRVEQLLEHTGDEPQVDASMTLTRELLDGAAATISGHVGGYEILESIGRGGMGEVFAARQRDPERTVAVKVLREGLFDTDSRKRFTNEARLLAQLKHPNIAQVIATGVHVEETAIGPRELPFLVLEHVDGARTLLDHVEHGRLSLTERLDLLVHIARAVHYGHQKGVIHRDLKPGNVLVNDRGEPKVIDFGIARATEGDLAQHTMLTQAGQVLGTIGYIAPEVLSGDVDFADARADVYSLGAMAYQLVIGELPFELANTPVAEAARRVVETDPIRPRSRLPHLDRDLEAVLLQAVARDPERRYGSAQALAEDLERWIRREPVLARTPGAWQHLSLFARRNPMLTGAFALILLLVVGGAIAFSITERNARVVADTLRERAERNEYFSSIVAAQSMLGSGEIADAKALLQQPAARYRGWEWRHLNRAVDGSRRVIRPFEDESNNLAILRIDYDPDRDLIAVSGLDGTLALIRRADGEILGTYDLPAVEITKDINEGFGTGAYFTANPDRVLVLRRYSPDRSLVDLRTGEVTPLPRTDDAPVTLAAISPDRRLGAVVLGGIGRMSRSIAIYDLLEGTVSREIPIGDQAITAFTFTHDGRYALAGTFAGQLLRFDLAETVPQRETLDDHPAGSIVRSLAIAPSSDRVVAVATARVTIWDARTGKREATIDSSCEVATWLDEDHLVLALTDHGLGIIEATDGASRLEIRANGHDSSVQTAFAFHDGHGILTHANDGTIREWTVAEMAGRRTFRLPRAVMAMAAGSGRFLTGDSAGRLAIRQSDGQIVAELDAPGPLYCATPRAVDDVAILGSPNGRIDAVDLRTGSLETLADDLKTSVMAVAWHPDGAWFATADTGGRIIVWSPDGQRLREHTEEILGGLRCLAIDDTGERILTGDGHGEIVERRADDLSVIARMVPFGRGAQNGIQAVGYVPGSPRQLVFSTIAEQLVLLTRSPGDGEPEPTVLQTGQLAWTLCFHPDEPRMFSANMKGRIAVWDTEHWRKVTTIDRGPALLTMQIVDDVLVTGNMTGTVSMWKTRPAR